MAPFDYEVLEQTDGVKRWHSDFPTWCRVEYREENSSLQAPESVYLCIWTGSEESSGGLYLNPHEARKIARWLLEAADQVEGDKE